MALILNRKQSLVLGVGLLVAFFAISSTVIYQRSTSRIPTSSSGLTREAIEGPSVSNTVPPQGTAGQPAGFVLDEFHRSLVRDGRTIWEVYGSKGRYSPQNNSAEVERPRLTLSRKEGENVSLSAARALLNLEGTDLNKAELFDDVVLIYKEMTLKTSKAIYNKNTNSVEVPAPVEIETEAMKVTGNSLHGNLDSQEFIVGDGVTTLIKPRMR